MGFTSSYNFAYYTVHRKLPPGKKSLLDPPIVTTKEYNNITVESVMKDSWLDSIFDIETNNRKVISICGGRSKLYLSHLIFFLNNTNRSQIETLVDKFDEYMNIECSYIDETNTSKFICLSTRNWYRYGTSRNIKWGQWWNNIITVIHKEGLWQI